MLYNQNESCVKSCKNIALNTSLFSEKKTHCFSQKPIVFQHDCALFYPIVLKQKIITDYNYVRDFFYK